MAMESKENQLWQGDNFNPTTNEQYNTKYLNYTGLIAFWEKAKNYVNKQDKAVFDLVNTKVNNQDTAIRSYIESLSVNGQTVVKDPTTGLGTDLSVTIGGEDIAVRRVADSTADVAWQVKDEDDEIVTWDVNKNARGHSYSDGTWKVDDAIENIDARLDAVQTELLEGVVSGLNVTSTHGTYKSGTAADGSDDVANKKWVSVTGTAYSATKQTGDLTLDIDDTAINEQFNSLDDKINFLEANAGVTNIKVTDIDETTGTNKGLVELSLKGTKFPNGNAAEDATGVTDAQRRGDIEIILDETVLDAKLDTVDATIAAEIADRQEDIEKLAGDKYTYADGDTAGSWDAGVVYTNITNISDRLEQIDANLVAKIVDGNDSTGGDDPDKNAKNEKYVSFTVAETTLTGGGANDKVITLTLNDGKLQEYIDTLNDQLGNIGETKINGQTLLQVTTATTDGYENITLTKNDVTLTTSNIDRPSAPSQGPAASTKNLEETLAAYDGAFAALVSATEFKGVVAWDPTNVTIIADGLDSAGVTKYKITGANVPDNTIMQNGDIVISGDKEFILDVNNTTEPTGPKFIELGDVTAEVARLDAIETWIDTNIISQDDINALDYSVQTFAWTDLA